jgi:hypothetical protein
MIKRWSIVAYLLGIIGLLLRFYASAYPEETEIWYSEFFYFHLRTFYQWIFGWIPFPVIYILLPLMVFGLISMLFISRRKRSAGWRESLVMVFHLGAYLSALFFLFLVLWGYNYCRMPMEQRLNMHVQPLTQAELRVEFIRVTDQLIAARSRWNEQYPTHLEQKIAVEVSGWLAQQGYRTGHRIRGRVLQPDGIMLRIGTAGFYFPYSGEGHVDAGLHPLQVPAVMAHELAHGHGFGDEGVCNFIAYASGIQSKEPLIVYSAYLSYWRTVAAQYRSLNATDYLVIRSCLSDDIEHDLRSINNRMALYPDLFPQWRDAVYERYLKTQGIAEGMKSYHKVIMLAVAFQKRKFQNHG